jgi:hypothetical protein
LDDETACERLTEGLVEQLWREVRGGAIGKGTAYRGHWKSADPHALGRANIPIMDQHPRRDSKPAVMPTRRKRQVHTGRKDVGEAVKGQRRVMRDDSLALGPEPDSDEILVFTGRKMDEAVDATPHAGELPRPDVVGEQLRGVPGQSRLLCREVALLSGRRLEEAIPARAV